jgi:DNA-binding NarL/FixJ family response regulator
MAARYSKSPRTSTLSDVERGGHASSALSPGLEPGVRRARVLVVDDNASFRETLLELLEAGDLDVVGEAESGADALDLAKTADPDVVLMDVRMPGMDGIEATRLLKQAHPSLGVVALSGHEDHSIVREMLFAGASGYVLKDSNGDEILNAVVRAATGGALLSPAVTPSVIEELTEALHRERRRTRELEEAQAALVESATRRHELVARLSHELRTPVTVILGMAQAILEGWASPEQEHELLDDIVESARDLVRLVERFELTTEAGLTEMLSVAEIARQVAKGRPCVRVEADPDLPTAGLNPSVAKRVLGELVDNAERFSPAGSPVDVLVNLGQGRIEVRVVDRGPGIEPIFRERIFTPLEQLEDLNVRVHQGVGLGLSLARSAARGMDGDVMLERSGPDGSTFLWTIALES